MFIPAEVIDSDAESGVNNFITKSQDFGNCKFMVQGFCLSAFQFCSKCSDTLLELAFALTPPYSWNLTLRIRRSA